MTSRRWFYVFYVFYVKQGFHSSQFHNIASDRTLPITSSRRCSPSTRTRSWWRWWRLTSECRDSRRRYDTMLPWPGSGQQRTTTRSILRRAAREPRRGAWTPSSATARRSPGWPSTTLILIFHHLPAPPSSGSSGPHLACSDTFNNFQHLVKPIVHSILLFTVSIIMWFYLSWHFTMWCQVYDDYLQYKLIIYDDKDDIEEWAVGRLEYRLNGRHVCEDCLLVLQTECPVSTAQNIARLFTIPNPALLLRSPSVEIGRPTSRNPCQVTFLQSIFSIQS